MRNIKAWEYDLCPNVYAQRYVRNEKSEIVKVIVGDDYDDDYEYPTSWVEVVNISTGKYSGCSAVADEDVSAIVKAWVVGIGETPAIADRLAAMIESAIEQGTGMEAQVAMDECYK
jgi:hypothetical protein